MTIQLYVPRRRAQFTVLTRRLRQPALWLGLAVLLYAAFFSLLTVQRHHSQLTTANDMGIFDQILWNVIHGRGMQRTIEINFSHWGVHTQPIIYLIAPFYLIYPAPETLLVLQSVALALSAVPLYLVAKRDIQHSGLALLLTGAYLLSPALQGMNLIDFHPYAFAPLFLLWAFYYLDTPHTGRFALMAVLAIACKEDVALVIAMLGLYAAVFRGKRQLGAVTFTLGLGWYILVVGLLQPHFSGGFDKQGWRYKALAWPLPELVRTILLRPGVWIPYALAPAKRAYLLGLLWPFGFLPLLAPQVVGIALPALMINLLSSFAAQHQPDLFQYNAAIVPFLALGAVRGVAWLRQLARRQNWKRPVTLAASILLAVGSLSYQFAYGHTPASAHFRLPECGAHCAVRSQFLLKIPAGAAVAAQTTLVPHVSQRPVVYEYPQGLDVVDYVFLDVTAPHYAIPSTTEYYASIESLWRSEDFNLLAAQDGYLLFKRGGPGAAATTFTLPPQFYSYVQVPDSTPAPAIDLALDLGPLRLVGADVSLAREGWVDMTLYWRALSSVPPGYRPSIAVGYTDGKLTAWHRQELPLHWSGRGWQTGETIQLTTGVSTGEGSGAGWGTRWTLYAGVVDDATGNWLAPAMPDGQPFQETRPVPLDQTTAYLVPVSQLRNYWGVTVLQETGP